MPKTENFGEQDRSWLMTKMPYASENQIEYFLEKVGKLAENNDMPCSIARANALKMMKYAGVK